MGFYNWTLRQKAKVAIPVVIAASFALQNVACSQAADFRVRNDAAQPFLYADTDDCDDLSPTRLRFEDWEVVQPGLLQEAYKLGSSDCLIVANTDLSQAVRVELKEDALYVLTSNNGRPLVQSEGGHTQDDAPLGGIILTVILGVPGLLGMLAAAFITLRFFYRYYFRGDKSAQLQ